MKYQFNSETINRDDAVDLIATVAYGQQINDRTLDLRGARKRVRSRIEYAVRKGILPSPDASTHNFPAPKFFPWAVYEWPELMSVELLPLPPDFVPPGQWRAVEWVFPLFGMAGTHETIPIPVDRAELEKAYVQSKSNELSFAKQIEALRHHYDELVIEMAELRQRRARRTKQMHKSGKKGGRGNTA